MHDAEMRCAHINACAHTPRERQRRHTHRRAPASSLLPLQLCHSFLLTCLFFSSSSFFRTEYMLNICTDADVRRRPRARLDTGGRGCVAGGSTVLHCVISIRSYTCAHECSARSMRMRGVRSSGRGAQWDSRAFGVTRRRTTALSYRMIQSESDAEISTPRR
jgi:hypothetical protein